jgi:nucleotide-binding universal stress UspA family protein
MKTLLIPTDFSPTARHAAFYAAELCKQNDIGRLILLNSFYGSIYENIFPSPDFVVISEEEIQSKIDERTQSLEALKNELALSTGSEVIIETHLSRLSLNRAILRLIEDESVDMVIVGSNGTGASEDSEIGENAVTISRICPVPVIIVPPTGNFQSLKRVVLACDFKKVTETIPLKTLKSILKMPSIELLVVNVDPEGRNNQWDPELIAEQTDLHQLLKCFNPKYYFTSHSDTISGIIDFATRREAQLIIALPKKYSFFESILHSSISKKLAIHSPLPVLLLKEEVAF